MTPRIIAHLGVPSGARTNSTSRPPPTQLTQLTETNSNGTQRITRMTYPADYASGAANPEAVALTAMKADSVHNHAAVVERWVIEKQFQPPCPYSRISGGSLALPYEWDTKGTQNAAGTAVWTALNTVATCTYDLRGQLTFRGLTIASAIWNQWIEYDGRGLLWRVFAATTAVKPATADVTYAYRPSGVPATRQYAGGPNVPFTFTIREQLAGIGDPALTTYPFSARYAYHANGRVSEQEFY